MNAPVQDASGAEVSPVAIVLPPPLALPAVSTLSTYIIIDDDLGVTQRWDLAISASILPAELLARLRVDPEVPVLVPLLSRSDLNDDVDLVLHADSRSVTVEAVPEHSTVELARLYSEPSLGEFLVVQLSARQVLHSPVLSLSRKMQPLDHGLQGNRPGESRLTRALRASREAFSPVAIVNIPFDDSREHRLSDIRVELAAGVVSEIVGLDFTFNPQTPVLRATIEDSRNPPFTIRALKLELNMVKVNLARVRDLGGVKPSVKARLARIDELVDDWLRDFADLDLLRMNPEAAQEVQGRAIERVKTIFRGPPIRFSVVAPIDQGYVELDDLAAKCLAISSMKVPYVDGNPGRRTRPATLLIILAVVQFVLAWRLSFKLAPPYELLSSDVALSVLNENREPLVAILLLFPAVLYVDVFQGQPTTKATRLPWTKFHWLLRVAFAAPLLSVVAVIGTAEPYIASWVLGASGVLALAVSGVALLTAWTRSNRQAIVDELSRGT